MMKDESYRILGLEEGASKEEIKKAYFRLVRKYSPEKEPERFQEIRQAYEFLQQDFNETKRTTVCLEVPDAPAGRQMMARVEEYYEKKEFGLAMDTAEAAINCFGECSGFLYFLALAQRSDGMTGKAVRTFQLLTERFPEEMGFWRELALSCWERGFGKKAYDAFEKAYSMGCRGLDFLKAFSSCCYDRKQFERGLQIEEEIIAFCTKKKPFPIAELLDAYIGCLSISRLLTDEAYLGAVRKLQSFLAEQSFMLKDYEEELEEILAVAAAAAAEIPGPSRRRKKGISAEACREAGALLLSEMKTLFPEKQSDWKRLESRMTYFFCINDRDLSENVKKASASFLIGAESDEMISRQVIRFAQTESKLYLLEGWPINRREFKLIRERYPLLYQMMEEFYLQLESIGTRPGPDGGSPEELVQLRNVLLKEYERLNKYYDGTYFDDYPQRRSRKITVAWDSDEEGTFRRSGKKVGRNDPCPCGSGRKYKNCCGR